MTRLRNAWTALRGKPDPAVNFWVQEVTRLGNTNHSLTASLDDANRTIARLSSEKVELERVIATVKETVGGF